MRLGIIYEHLQRTTQLIGQFIESHQPFIDTRDEGATNAGFIDMIGWITLINSHIKEAARQLDEYFNTHQDIGIDRSLLISVRKAKDNCHLVVTYIDNILSPRIAMSDLPSEKGQMNFECAFSQFRDMNERIKAALEAITVITQ